MIYWSKRDGYTYKDEDTKKEYTLFEMMCYQGTASSDVIAIWDEEKNCFANHVYGATLLHENIEELNNTIKFYVDAYENQTMAKTKQKANISYKFTQAGVKAFLHETSEDFFEEMEKDFVDKHLEKFDIVITCGTRKITIPLGAEQWNALEDCLTEAVEDWEA